VLRCYCCFAVLTNFIWLQATAQAQGQATTQAQGQDKGPACATQKKRKQAPRAPVAVEPQEHVIRVEKPCIQVSLLIAVFVVVVVAVVSVEMF